jgi:hypothetical protein
LIHPEYIARLAPSVWITVKQEVRLKEEHDRPMARRPQVDEA